MHKKKKTRPSILDVSRAAGVSTATVDRVLNNRGGVREGTMLRVKDAAHSLGYIPAARGGSMQRTKPLKIFFLLPDGTNPYINNLVELIRAGNSLPSGHNITCGCKTFKGFDAGALAEAIDRHSGDYDGIVVMGLEHPLVREAVNNAIKNGTWVVTIITDLSHSARSTFVGLDNHAVGRTAAYLLANLCNTDEGDVGLIAGSLSYRAHNEREMGFLSYMQESFPKIKVVGAREGHDDYNENYALTKALLSQHDNLIGIYNIGGSSGGVGDALRKSGKKKPLVFIGHGLGEDTRMMLLDGTMDIVIHQDPVTMIHSTCQIFGNIARQIDPMAGIPALSMQIICRENLP